MLVTGARCATPSLADSIALDHLGSDRAEYGRVRLWTSIGWAVACCVWGAVLAAGSLSSTLRPARSRLGLQRGTV